MDFSQFISSITPENAATAVTDSKASPEDTLPRETVETVPGQALPSWYPHMSLPIEKNGNAKSATEVDENSDVKKHDDGSFVDLKTSEDTAPDHWLPKQQLHFTPRSPHGSYKTLQSLEDASTLQRPDDARVIVMESSWPAAEEHVGVADIGPNQTIPPASAVSVASGSGPTLAAALPDTSPGHQIITKLANSPALPAPSRMEQSDIKILRIKLMPEELGNVEVMLRQAGEEMVVHISVNSEATAEAVRRDLAWLEDRLGLLFGSASSRAITVAVQAEMPVAGGPLGQDGRPQAGGGFNTQANAQDRRPSPERDELTVNWTTKIRNDEPLSLESCASGRSSITGLVV